MSHVADSSAIGPASDDAWDEALTSEQREALRSAA
jgi:hypothetical protein